jgi:sigma-B regulation protein RsbU (phosphoserine phosphatase)
MAMLHAWLRSLAELQLEMTDIMTRVNTVLLEQGLEGEFVTLIMLRIDAKTRTLTYVDAGHPTGWVLDRSGVVRSSLSSLSLPLGIDAAADFPVGGPVLLESGEVLVLATDGAQEAQSPDGGQFGTHRILEVIRGRLAEPKEEIIKNLRTAIEEFTGTSKCLDDITFVLAKVE